MTARLALLAGLALFAGGCATVDFAQAGSRQLVNVENVGWYLFNAIPIATGDPERPNSCSCRLFRDTVTLENNMKLLDYAVRKTGATGTAYVTSHSTDEKILIIFLKRYAFHTSAELLHEPPAPEAAAAPSPAN